MSESNVRISVVTAVYNNVATIGAAIESALSQRHPAVEIIVIDGGSTDGTLDIISRYKSRLGVLVSEPDRGIYDALNKGVRLATGDVIGFLHSDDLFADRDALSRVAAAMSDPAVSACYGDLNYVSKAAPEHVVRSWRSGLFAPGKLRFGWMPPHPTLYVRRQIYSRVGEFNCSYRIAADYDWMLRFMGQSANMLYIPRVQVLMRTGGTSNRSFKNILRKSAEDFSALRSNGWGALAASVALVTKNVRKVGQFL